MNTILVINMQMLCKYYRLLTAQPETVIEWKPKRFEFLHRAHMFRSGLCYPCCRHYELRL